MCNGGPKPGGSSEWSSANAPSVSSAPAFTDTLHPPPRSRALPSSARRTKALPTLSVMHVAPSAGDYPDISFATELHSAQQRLGRPEFKADVENMFGPHRCGHPFSFRMWRAWRMDATRKHANARL